eukprot:CAMPEP_0206539256 /NCGR_PEP_ID=MMETSP0325_2-20121206/8334_1 /ASSEMBLY_ACC=CAM_ASM_000347 /TAXON_ID=2866 /ORGANISM="Crypthecodinium cohnii, Strain Seligo" /LENGTH=295 /DNA_ID=CAMNT_0054036819 /DNA_START=439 /DNA_END=1323 /DNA_ORIENTATION=-
MTAEELVVGMEACDCVLWDILVSADGQLGELEQGRAGAVALQRFSLARDVAQAVAHCHDLGIIHRDINPWNIFLIRGGGQSAAFYSAKLGDFGLSAKLRYNDENLTGVKGNEDVPPLDDSALGSLYSAPELGHTYGLPADVFSLGMVFLVLWATSVSQNEDQLITHVEMAKTAAQQGTQMDWQWFHRSDKFGPADLELLELLSEMVLGEPKARPTAATVFTTLDSFDQSHICDTKTRVQVCFDRCGFNTKIPKDSLAKIINALKLGPNATEVILKAFGSPTNQGQPQEGPHTSDS